MSNDVDLVCTSLLLNFLRIPRLLVVSLQLCSKLVFFSMCIIYIRYLKSACSFSVSVAPRKKKVTVDTTLRQSTLDKPTSPPVPPPAW